MKIIDFHTHAFADALAPRAISALQSVSQNIRACTDGTIAGLRAEMRASGVAASVVANIATKPLQFAPILEWSKSVAADDIIPFGSIHPGNPDPAGAVEQLVAAGLRGLKIHPFYQDCAVDDERWFPLYDAWQQTGLPLLFHAGFDVAFGDSNLAHPFRFKTVRKNFPKLVIVMAHMGAWKAYQDFLDDMCGQEVYIDTSCSAGLCPLETAREILRRHGAEHILYATDCPWGTQQAHLDFVRAFCPDEDRQELILGRNAARLLRLPED